MSGDLRGAGVNGGSGAEANAGFGAEVNAGSRAEHNADAGADAGAGAADHRQIQIEKVRVAFEGRYGNTPQIVVRAPGRVNLIGEHTDYNEGFVFPCAIDREVVVAASAAGGDLKHGEIRVFSLNYDEDDVFEISSIGKSERQWANYMRGVVSILQDAGHKVGGFSAVVCGDVPQGAGLSSSAAYEVAVATLLNDMYKLGIEPKEIALLAQRAENKFVGVQCGIMDQFISALGQEDSALLIDCRSLTSRAVPMYLSSRNCAIVITHSGVKRGLVDSEYNQRRRQCAAGTAALAQLLGREIVSLRDVDLAEFEAVSDRLDKEIGGRCRHVISENGRVLAAVACLESGDLDGFGRLMALSHDSLRDDFEVSCPELDLLVALSQRSPGVIGARMTGGGFGGCAVALISEDGLEKYRTEVIPEYERRSGMQATVYICRATAGASVL